MISRVGMYFIVFAAGTTTLAAASAPKEGAVFNGKTSYAVVEDGRAFDLDALTVAARVKMNTRNGSQIFINRGEPGRLFTLYTFHGNVRMLIEYKPGVYTHAHRPIPPAGKWVHLAGTYDGRQIRLYVDGALASSVAAPGRIPKSDEPLYLGAAAPGMRTLDGAIEDARIWNRALSAEAIGRLASGAEDEATAEGLVGCWNKASLEGERWGNRAAPALLAAYHADPKITLRRADGYRGIWYSNQRQGGEYVFKYSGGLGTYCAKHLPFAVYCKKVDKTFFCYGGTNEKQGALLHMVSYYDHATGTVPRPVILLDKHTTDAHDNPVISVDDDGHVWIFSTTHGAAPTSFLHRSKKPYNIEQFEPISLETLGNNHSYSQPHYLSGRGFLFMHTHYDAGRRNIYQTTSPDGVHWTARKLLGKIEMGHYQVSGRSGTKVGTAFNFHPAPKGLNWRTNLYYMETDDFGKTWKNIRGEKLELPLTKEDNPALVHDFRAEGRNVYMKDLVFDDRGRPVILTVTSGGWESGPVNDPRTWTTARWTGKQWDVRGVIHSDNNYDMGSLYLEGENLWRLIGPTEPGPQRYNTGGEIAMWTSTDQGATWKKVKQLTEGSEYNHTFVRRPVHAHPDFYGLWADGHGRMKSGSRLYFTNRDGDHVWRLPVKMDGETARPEVVR